MKAISPLYIYFDLIADLYKYTNIFDFIIDSRLDSFDDI